MPDRDDKLTRIRKILARFYVLFWQEDVLSRSAQVAFYLSFSLFPLLIFLVSLFGIILGQADSLRSELFSYLKQIMPQTAYMLVRNTITEVTQNSSTGKLTFGLIVALWSASSGIDSLRIALNHLYLIKESRNWWRTKAESLVITLLLITFMSFVLGTVFYGWQFVSVMLLLINLPVESVVVLQVIQWLSFILVLLITFGMFYRFLPDQPDYRCRWFSAGSLLAITLWLIATNGFRLYLDYFNTYDRTYGSLGAVMILMLWLYLTAVAILMGGLLNAVLEEFASADRAFKASLEESETNN